MELILAGVMVLTGLSVSLVGSYKRHIAERTVSSAMDNLAHSLTADYTKGPKPRTRPSVAIFTFDATGRLGEEGFGIAASNLLAKKLAERNDFIVVGKSRVRKLITAQSHRPDDIIDLDTAVRFGKLLGAQVIVLGTISEEADHYRVEATSAETSTGKVVSRADQAIPRNRFETRAKRYLSSTPPKRTLAVYYSVNSRNNPNDVDTFQYDRSYPPMTAVPDPFFVTVRPKSFTTHFQGFGLRYFPHPQWMFDASAAWAPGSSIAIETMPAYSMTIFDDLIRSPEWHETPHAEGILLVRANINRVQPLKYGFSGVLGAGFSWYQSASFGKSYAHAGFSKVVPSLRAGLEYRRRSRWSLSLFVNHDVLNATAKYRMTRYPANSTAAELSRWSVEPTIAFNF